MSKLDFGMLKLVLFISLILTTGNATHIDLLKTLEKVMRQHFPPGQTVLVSVPSVGNLSFDKAQFLDITQKTLHNAVSWPFLVSRPDFGSLIENNLFLQQFYIIFVWPDEHNLISDDSVDTQLE